MGGWEKLVVLDLRIGRIKYGRQSEEIFYVGKSLMEKRFWWSCATLCMLTREVIGLSSLWSL